MVAGWVLVRGYQRVDGVLRAARLGGSGVECGGLVCGKAGRRGEANTGAVERKP